MVTLLSLTGVRMLIKCVCLLQATCVAIEGVEFGAHAIDISHLSTLRQMTSTDYKILNIEEGAVREGAFGYEEFEWPCFSDMTAAYGYALGQCSRGPSGESYIYNWCALSEDTSIVYFHVTEYPGSNCTQTEKYNNTFWDFNTCDAVNSRRPFCTPSKQGWTDYAFDQHIE